jgi:hypothetical protein
MKKLKILFLDFWPEMVYENIFLPILKKHFDVEINASDPDVIIHSIFGNVKETPKYKCKKILFLGENYRAKNFGSNFSISFDPPSETNYRLPLWQFYLILRPELKEKLFNRSNNFESFDRFCSFTVSNPANFLRNAVYDQLSSYKRVSSYGKMKMNDLSLQKLSEGKYWRDAKYQFFLEYKHKFALTYEHSSYPYYCTEKLMDGFLGGSLPLYWGDPKVTEDWNKKAFINVIDFGSQLIDTIKKLDNDKSLFDSYYNEPVFTEEQKKRHLKNLENFENWLITAINK